MNTTTESNIYIQISLKIIREQELIIGPLAWKEAEKVKGLNIKNREISLEGDVKEILNNLVSQYEKLFGYVSREVCKEAARSLIAELPKEDVPSSLQ